MVDFKDLMDKGKQFIDEHPDQAREAVEKLEDMVDARTGQKYQGQVDKAGDFIEGKLGVGRPDAAPVADPQAESQQ